MTRDPVRPLRCAVYTRRLALELRDANIVVPERVDGAGRSSGGKPFSRGHLYAILGNPIYVGQLSHKGRIHAGLHPPIVEPAIFDAVQRSLAGNTRRGKAQVPSEHLLTGRMRDDRGHPMRPTHAQKGSLRYRYYVSRAVQQGRKSEAGSVPRVPAAEIEVAILAAIRTTKPKSKLADAELIHYAVREVTVRSDSLDLELASGELIQVPWTRTPTTRRREIILSPGQDRDRLRPAKSESRARILKTIAKAKGWLEELTSGRLAGTDAIASRERCSERSARRTLALAFLSPAIVKAIVEGRLPRGISIAQLAELPSDWDAQRQTFGF